MALSLVAVLVIPEFIGQPVRADSRALPPGLEKLELQQRRDIARDHQRRVGNARAQARREGIIRTLPQLFAYYGDETSVYHMHGYNRGFTLVLDSSVRRGSRVRDMVSLEALLENTRDADGQSVEPADLPDADMIFIEYWQDDCDDCEKVREDLQAWLEERPLDSVLWIRVRLGS